MPFTRVGRTAVPLLLLPSLLWILTDRHVWPWDPAWYGEVTADLWSTIVRDSMADWGRLMLHAIPSKPPAVVWIGQLFAPLNIVLGWERALLLSVLATQALSLVLLYDALARLFGIRGPAVWAGVLSMAASPLFIGLSQQYFAEPIQLLSVCLFLWIAAARHGMGRLRLFAWLLLATVLGMAAKTTSPIYAFGFGFVALPTLFRRTAVTENRVATAVLAVIAVGLAALTTGWYVVNAEQTWRHALDSATGSVALNYGSAGAFSTKLAFWLGTLKAALLLPGPWPILAAVVFAAAVLITVVLVAGPSLAPRWRGPAAAGGAVAASLTPATPLLVAALLQIAVALSAFSLNINEESRFLLPLFPSVALLAAALVAGVGAATGRRTVGAAAVVLFILQWAAANAMALGALPVRADNPWLQARQTDGNLKETLARLAAVTCPASDAGRINLVGTEQPWLNANTLSFFSARERAATGWRCYYTSLGYGETDVDQAWKRLEAMRIDFVIMLDADRAGGGNFLNRINVPIRQRMETDAGFATVPFPDGASVGGIAVFRRRQP